MHLDGFSLARFGWYCKLKDKVAFFTRILQFCSEFGLDGKKLGFWQNVVYSYETRVRLNTDGVVRVVRKPGRRFCPKNTQGLSQTKNL